MDENNNGDCEEDGPDKVDLGQLKVEIDKAKVRTGALDGGGGGGGSLMSHVDFKKWQCRMSLSLYFPQCHMSNLRKGYVPCHYKFYLPVACHYALCRISILRKGHVTLSILGVKAKVRTLSYSCLLSLVRHICPGDNY